MPHKRWFLANAAKLSIALCLTTWMVLSGRLNPTDLIRVLHSRESVLLMAVACGGNVLGMAYRWKQLLRISGMPVTGSDVISLSMIGNFFSIVIPGAVSGDIVKGYYISQRFPKARVEAAATVLMDRLIGLLSLLILASVAGLWNLNAMSSCGPVHSLYFWVVLAAASGLLTVATIIRLSEPALRVADRAATRFASLAILPRGLRALATLKKAPSVLLATFLLSLPGQIALCVAFYIISLSLSPLRVPLSVCFILVPLGLIILALPISPAGIGVGQIAFYSLFEFSLPGTGRSGATLCTIYQIVLIVVSLTGIIPYLTIRIHRCLPTGDRDDFA